MPGDICERDEEGNYRVVERSKDLIKYKGELSNLKATPPTLRLTSHVARTGFQVAPAE